jgi:hypothetical protein
MGAAIDLSGFDPAERNPGGERLGLGAGGTALALLLALAILGAAVLLRPYWRTPVAGSDSEGQSLQVLPLLPDRMVEYTFTSPVPILGGLDLQFATYDRINRSYVFLCLSDKKTGRILSHEIVNAMELADWKFYTWRFGIIKTPPGREMVLRVSGFLTTVRSCPGLVATPADAGGKISFKVDGQETPAQPSLAFLQAGPVPPWSSPLVWYGLLIALWILWLSPAGLAANADIPFLGGTIRPAPPGRGGRAAWWTGLIWSTLILGGCLAFRVWRTTKGIDLGEEGMHLATAQRYALGDLPFRDEIMNVFRMYDVMVSPIFRFFPDITLLQMRWVGLSVQALALAAAYFFFRRYIGPLVLASLLAVIMVVHDTYGVAVPSYNLLSSVFLMTAVLSWLVGLRGSSQAATIGFSSLAGVLTGLAGLSYFSMFGMAAIPVGVFLAGLVRPSRRRVFIGSAISFLGSYAALLGLVAFILLKAGLWPDLLEAVGRTLSTNLVVKVGVVAKILNYLSNLVQFLPRSLAWLGLVALPLVLVRWDRSRPWGFLGLAVLLGWAGLALFGTGAELPPHGTGNDYFFTSIKQPLMGLAVFLGLAVLVVTLFTPLGRKVDPERRIVCVLGLLWGLAGHHHLQPFHQFDCNPGRIQRGSDPVVVFPGRGLESAGRVLARRVGPPPGRNSLPGHVPGPRDDALLVGAVQLRRHLPRRDRHRAEDLLLPPKAVRGELLRRQDGERRPASGLFGGKGRARRPVPGLEQSARVLFFDQNQTGFDLRLVARRMARGSVRTGLPADGGTRPDPRVLHQDKQTRGQPRTPGREGFFEAVVRARQIHGPIPGLEKEIA